MTNDYETVHSAIGVTLGHDQKMFAHDAVDRIEDALTDERAKVDRIEAERDRWRNASAIHTRTIAALVAERDGFCRVCGAGVPPLDGEGTCPDCPAALEGTDQPEGIAK